MKKLNFYYMDDLKNKTRLIKIIPETYLTTDFELLVEEFKNFLIAVGFTQESVNCIKIIED